MCRHTCVDLTLLHCASALCFGVCANLGSGPHLTMLVQPWPGDIFFSAPSGLQAFSEGFRLQPAFQSLQCIMHRSQNSCTRSSDPQVISRNHGQTTHHPPAQRVEGRSICGCFGMSAVDESLKHWRDLATHWVVPKHGVNRWHLVFHTTDPKPRLETGAVTW